MDIPEAVLEQVQAALNTAIGVTLVHAQDQNGKMLSAATALDDAINTPPPRKRGARRKGKRMTQHVAHRRSDEIAHLRQQNVQLREALAANRERLAYFIGNPSAWDNYDDAMSDRLRECDRRALAVLIQRPA